VKLKEDFRATPYNDSRGYLTIGYGCMVDPRLGGGLTRDEGEYILRNRLRIAEAHCEQMPAYLLLSPARQAVLIEMCFNMGPSRLAGFKRMFAALERQAYDHAASEMLDSDWSAQVKGRAVELSEQMKTGQWP
jgi:lysozyme